jgi:hypothetical protein
MDEPRGGYPAALAIAELASARYRANRARLEEADAVRWARANGTTWTTIGALYGITKQSAAKRWPQTVESSDERFTRLYPVSASVERRIAAESGACSPTSQPEL